MFVTKEKLSWTEARSWCNRSGADLATIINKDEQQLMKDKLPKREQGFWIGLNDIKNETDFKWVDGTPYRFKNWNIRQPSGGRKENCVELHIDNSNTQAKWNDNICSTKLHFICRKTKSKYNFSLCKK